MKYTFDQWVNHNCDLPEEGPTDAELARFPKAPKFVEYRPAWGKGGKSQEKAVRTRNRKIYDAAKETFRREVLPLVADRLDTDSLFKAGKDLADPELLRRSGYQFYAIPEERRGQWLAPDSPLIEKAIAMGASILAPETWIAEWNPATANP